MKPIIKEMKDITDSKEMYESKPHPFLGICICIVLFLIVGASMWAYLGEIDLVSKGLGVVRPNGHLSSIRNKTGGEIEYYNLKEGQNVTKGEVLFNINHDDLDIKLKQLEESLAELTQEGNRLKKLRKSVEEGKNLFFQETELEDYERYVKYEQDYRELQTSNTIASKNDDLTVQQTEINKSIYNENIEKAEIEHNELNEYKASILAEQSLFTNPDCARALEFKAYLYDIQELEVDIKAKKEIYTLNKTLNEEGLVAQQELASSKVAVELAENELAALKNKTLEGVEKLIEQNQDEIKSFRQESSKLVIDYELLSQKNTQRDVALKTYKTNYLINLYDQIDANKRAYNTQKKEVEAIKLQIKNCEVTSPIDGTVNIINKVGEGELVLAGDNIANIIPTEDNLYTIEIFVPNNEIANIKVGNSIKYKFDALPYKEYGELEGKITNISSDAQYNETYGTSGYVVEGSIVNQTVYSYKGEAAEIKVGMTCEAHVITAQKKILYYLLEKINLRG